MLVMLTELAAFSSPTVMLCLNAIFNVIFLTKACFCGGSEHRGNPPRLYIENALELREK
jgi:hypothetical protein